VGFFIGVEAMRVGIIGLGRSGKSSLFHSLTGLPNEPPSGKPRRRLGRAIVPEPRVELVAKLDGSKKITYPDIGFADPEGFPPESAKSLGSEMLGMVRDAELIALVIRAFTAPTVMHPAGNVDGKRDLETCIADLIIQDLAVLENIHAKAAKEFERGKKELKREVEAVHKAIDILSGDKFLSQAGLTQEEKTILATYEPLTLKQGIVVWNVDEGAEFGRGGVGVPDEIKDLCENRGWGVGAASLKVETEIMDIDPSERDEFLKDLGLTETIRDRFLGAIYKRLGLITFFTGGSVEAAARQVPSGSTAWDAAGKVHNDIQKGFIRAEVMSFQDLEKFGSVDAVRKAGKYRLEKREYTVQDGDIIHFRFNA
jgi:GTP-binding protein YchF